MMDNSLQKIIDWAKIHASQTLDYLNAPANDEDIQKIETEIGVELPDSFKALLKKFDGETGPWLALLGDGNQLLPCKQIIEQYRLEQALAKQFYDPEMETIEFWRDRVSSSVIFVKGAVKPLMRHPEWVPVTNMNGDVFRYLDYDPAPGGTPGQVIEVDPESCSYQVLADNFDAFLARYAQQLEAGLFKVDDEGYIESIAQDDMNWGVPAWLRESDV